MPNGALAGPAQGLERIVFWLNSSCQSGSGQITVTLDGETSNPLGFEITDAAIYFISVIDGDNNNNGQYVSAQGGSNGPWKDIYMFNPSFRGDGQYIIYVRGGIYSTLDAELAFVAVKGPYGDSSKRKALIGYPGETAELNALAASRGVLYQANYDPYGRSRYFTFSKINVSGGTGAFGIWGDYHRVVGCHMKDMRELAWSGVIMVDNATHARIYGNRFENCGYDSYKHNIYVKSHLYTIGGSPDSTCQYVYIGWNEFDSPYAIDNHGGTIFLSTQGYAYNIGHYTNHVWIHDNYFHDGNMDFLYTSDNYLVHYIYVHRNIFKGGTSGLAGIVIPQQSLNFEFYNNVFYQIGGAGKPMIFMGYDPSSSPSNPVFINNIWYGLPGQSFLMLESGNQTLTSDHDLYYDADGITELPAAGNIVLSNAVAANPLLADPPNGNFSPQSSSPVIDAGINVGLPYNGSAPDIGAIEYDGTTPIGTVFQESLEKAPALNFSASPNPLNFGTTLHLNLSESGPVSLFIYDLRGRLVARLWKADLQAGIHRFHWITADETSPSLPAGIYTAVLKQNNQGQMINLILIR